MASKVPAQSQPRHNFDLPPLKWSKENQSSRRRSVSIKSPSQKLSSESPTVESLSLSPLSSSASVQPMSVSRSHSGKSESESKKKPQGAEGNAAGIKGNGSKILIKFPCKNERKNQEEPRERGARENNGSENGANGGGGQKKEKRKLSFEISLSQREIEEDIYSLTGSRPNRRPKKRAKNVQKQLDDVFPGSWLASITPDSYKVLFFRVFRKLLIYSARRNSASLDSPNMMVIHLQNLWRCGCHLCQLH